MKSNHTVLPWNHCYESAEGGQEEIRVSVDSDGNQVTGGHSTAPSIPNDCRYVVFQSGAVNLVDDDTNGLEDIFVHDRDADEDGIFYEQNADEGDDHD